ncbi:hypothetical protein AAVH_00454 [Aphelenchoides avenae]|nr:hypothetical protein AAVH_00454 [Aphelenchus avenae]
MADPAREGGDLYEMLGPPPKDGHNVADPPPRPPPQPSAPSETTSTYLQTNTTLKRKVKSREYDVLKTEDEEFCAGQSELGAPDPSKSAKNKPTNKTRCYWLVVVGMIFATSTLVAAAGGIGLILDLDAPF